jgi:hypothetical protein
MGQFTTPNPLQCYAGRAAAAGKGSAPIKKPGAEQADNDQLGHDPASGVALTGPGLNQKFTAAVP